MTFEEILAQVREQLRREGRVAYRILKRRFALSDDDLEDLKADLIDAKRLAVDDGGKVLVWVGEGTGKESENRGNGESEKNPAPASDARPQTLDGRRDAGERRQLTVMFCDLVGSTALSEQLDPEELREVVQHYQGACEGIIHQLDGYVARYVGDALLVYFGYPRAHEDDAQRAVRAGLGIIAALQQWVPSPLAGEGQGEGAAVSPVATLPPHPNLPPQGGKEKTHPLPRLQVRIGIHSGLVVVGEMGGRDYREAMALGETPNIASRLQGLAEPDTVVISGATYRLVEGLFECQDLGPQTLKGISTPLPVYRVVREGVARSRFEAAVGRGLTPLVGREEELGLLRRCWAQAKEGAGQVVLLTGEAGIGKSRLVQELKEQAIAEGATRIEFRCSPYHRNSAFYPLIEHLQRLLQFAPHDTPQAKLSKLQQALATYSFPQADTFSLLASLLSLPHPEDIPPLTLSPQKQKRKTQEALVAWIVEEAERSTVFCAWEDLHWADPSTLEVLSLYLEQIPTTRIFTVLTFRPEFVPPWRPHSHLTQLTLSRLDRRQVEAMVEKVTGGKALPSEVLQQVVAKTDGVPLFVEELTKTVLELDLGVGARLRPGSSSGHVPLPLGIPATLHDALMARLDRLGSTKEVAQVGAILGREFSYELLRAVSPLDEALLQQGLRQLVEAELIYQRGLPPQATYLFKHALIQDTAYQSLLKSRRQQLHQQIAEVLAEQFPETIKTQPELLAHHYTEASLVAQAIPYWQRAGERATQRSDNLEAITHLTKGLDLLKLLPDIPERVHQELTFQVTLGAALFAVKGYAAPEVEKTYAQARELCQRLGKTHQLVPVLGRLVPFYLVRGELQTARELSEQALGIAQSVQNPYLLSMAHSKLGFPLYLLGELPLAQTHVERAITLYDPKTHPRPTLTTPDRMVDSLSLASWVLWQLGYPAQARKRSQEAMAWGRGLSHPFGLAVALPYAAMCHLHRREHQRARERAEEVITLATEQGFPSQLAFGTMVRGWALAKQGWVEEGIAQMRQLSQYPFVPALLAEAYGKVGQVDKGLTVLAEALGLVDKIEMRVSEAELYRLKGELSLQKSRVGIAHHNGTVAEAATVGRAHPTEEEAEACFLKAIDIA
ncbi:MAG TPA: adenylate/guanylate cyclase domain-containing protein, partial [Candidatus Binatia bacterium]|nr:adenylate/guanylate cyclase domain-containing protein [Candidatus Binatia bacterium]